MKKTRMLAILFLMFGTALSVTPESSGLDPTFTTNVFSVLSLFMLLCLTFSVSLYGVKRLMERSPKKIFQASAGRTLPRTSHDVISF